MDIDWSKAPEWTIGHALYAFGGEIYEAWVGEFQYQRLDQPRPFPYGDVGIGGAQHNPRRSWFKYATPRPEAWTGDSLPPAGTVCEVDYCDNWQRCEVIAQFSQRCGMVAAFTVESPGGAKSLDAFGSEYFRPIRTPEQIAAEAREAGIKEMLSVCPYPGSHEQVGRVYAEALYDAGYRNGYRKPTDQ